MTRLWSRALVIAAGVVLALGSAAAPAAATDLSAKANLCGSSYVQIDSYPIKRGSATYGYVELYWSSTARRNCALTVSAGSTYGWKGFKSISVCPSRTTDATLCGEDSGDFFYYAGPAYTKSGYNMSGKCVDVFGLIERRDGTTVDGGAQGVHCG